MKNKIVWIFAGFMLVILFAGCKSDVNSPGKNNISDDQLSFETLNSDMGLLKEGGMQFDGAAGVFSIGWNEMFRPFEDSSTAKGMSFAAAFGERETDLMHFRRFGLDMGSVFINYAGSQIEMHKRFHERRGFAYSLFERPFGNCGTENLLEFIPNTEYNFEVTGSEVFAPVTISLISPPALMDITSHSSGEIIDPAADLTLTWEGGNADGKVAVRLMPHLRQMRGPHSMPHHPPFDRVILVILDLNTGTYTFPAQQIQRMLNGIDADGIAAEVSQIVPGEVEHPNGILRTAMRNGSSVKLRIL